jgi:hypothetical protein
MAGSQIAGFTSANIAEVEAATKALRVTMRAEDYGALGIYQLAGSSAVMAANLAANSPIVAFRWADATKLCLVKRFNLSMAAGATAFAAGVAKFNLYVARSWSVNDTGGTQFLPSGNSNKLRVSNMGTSLVANGDFRIGQTGVLTAGTRTKDSQPLSSVTAGAPAVAGQNILAPFDMIYQRPGEFPLILAQNEGLVLESTVPATGVWQFSCYLDYSELAAYDS